MILMSSSSCYFMECRRLNSALRRNSSKIYPPITEFSKSDNVAPYKCNIKICSTSLKTYIYSGRYFI